MGDPAVRSKLHHVTIQKAADQKVLVFWDLKSLGLNIVCIPLSRGSFPESMLF